MNDFYKSPPIWPQFSVVRFTVNSVALPFDYAQELRSVALPFDYPSATRACKAQEPRSRRVEGSTVNTQHHSGATGIDIT